MGRGRYVAQCLGTLHDRIKKCRVLMVGAGGIGCELLKNLALTGFGEIHIVDLDTIDLSNLNRQFLFRHEHIKKSKALVAKETAAKFNPNVKIEAYHANIKDTRFSVDWFMTFNLVFNALDNLDARRHVNKMCLAADVPLIESGTTGFNGQVQVIRKGKTECYDCNTKEVPKSFPVCTIRSTPSQPIHSIVWAKSYLFTELFGMSDDQPIDIAHVEEDGNVGEIENLRIEAQALKRLRGSMGSDDFVQRIFQKVFKDDIERLQSMEDMWKSRKPPMALDHHEVSEDSQQTNPAISGESQAVWTLAENYAVFSKSLNRLSHRVQAQDSLPHEGSILAFDKDDEDILDFVAATANLRSIVFGIETKSKFDIKQMAGNIIPAIATTNAMTAGLCVIQAFKVLRDNLGKARMIFLERSAARVINTDTLKPPNPNCAVCSVAQTRLHVDVCRATLKDLVECVLRLQLGYGEELSVNNDLGVLFDPELDDNLPKTFKDLGIRADDFLTVIDENEDHRRVNLSLVISEKTFSDDKSPILMGEIPTIPNRTRSSTGDDLQEYTNKFPLPDNTIRAKRKRSIDDAVLIDGEQPKRVRMRDSPSRNLDLEILADCADGTILLEDD